MGERRTENEATNVIGAVVEAGDVHGDVRVRVSQPWRPAVQTPRQLPADVVGFSGREAEIEVLDSLLENAQDTGPVVISAVSGMPGAGRQRWPCIGRIAYATDSRTVTFTLTCRVTT
ncbi:hypothetical protein [Lentzea roselyniae]|uniref:hypothetical protein n=1 Tax=Lentzea roselyniae TaxID=531940 RepID=UPI0031F9F2D5